MEDETRRLVADLEAIAARISDPERREEVRRIIARLSDRGREWPDAEELARLRLRYTADPE
jgi:hypothetical protein